MNNLGCIFLEEGINFDLDKVMDCCISHNEGRGLPVLINNYHGETIDWNKLFETKEKRIQQQKEKTIYDCENCYHLGEYEFKGIKKISEFHFSHCRICNAKCVYCSKEYSKNIQNYSTYPIIKDLIEKGFYKSGGEATFQGGEPILMQNFEELIDLFNKNGTKIRVHSSAIKYSQAVANAIHNNNASIVISLDSASRNVYRKIKQVDEFRSVCENIKKYAHCAGENSKNIIIKYVIVPGYNDSILEINRFFALMKKLNIKNIAVDIEIQYARRYNNKNVSPHIFILYDYFVAKAKKCNMNLLTYSFISYVLKNRNFKETPSFSNMLLYGLYACKYRDKEKNISYANY